MAGWVALIGGCSLAALGIGALVRVPATPGARVGAVGLTLLGLSTIFGNVQYMAGSPGVREAAGLAAVVLALSGLVLTCVGMWVGRRARRTSRGV
jgi:hypothetical protein